MDALDLNITAIKKRIINQSTMYKPGAPFSRRKAAETLHLFDELPPAMDPVSWLRFRLKPLKRAYHYMTLWFVLRHRVDG